MSVLTDVEMVTAKIFTREYMEAHRRPAKIRHIKATRNDDGTARVQMSLERSLYLTFNVDGGMAFNAVLKEADSNGGLWITG